jgi:hypothetical protein
MWLCERILPEDLPVDHVGQASLTLIATDMAPNLPTSTLELTHDMLMSNELTTSEMADVVNCHPSTIRRHRDNLRVFGRVMPHHNKKGRPRRLTPLMIKALYDHLLEKPQLYLDEMVVFILDEFHERHNFFLYCKRWLQSTSKAGF